MLSDNKVIDFFYMADDYCKYFLTHHNTRTFFKK